MTPQSLNRRSVRLPQYDYTQFGAYFVTIVTAGRCCLFDDPTLRRLAEGSWLSLPQRLAYAELDAWVLMPNHLHAIIWIKWEQSGPDSSISQMRTEDEPRARTASLPARSIGAIVNSYKSSSTQRINAWRHLRRAAVWQRNYFEHVVRNDDDLYRIRKYIEENPLRWSEDEYGLRQ